MRYMFCILISIDHSKLEFICIVIQLSAIVCMSFATPTMFSPSLNASNMQAHITTLFYHDATL